MVDFRLELEPERRIRLCLRERCRRIGMWNLVSISLLFDLGMLGYLFLCGARDV